MKILGVKGFRLTRPKALGFPQRDQHHQEAFHYLLESNTSVGQQGGRHYSDGTWNLTPKFQVLFGEGVPRTNRYW